MTNYDTFGAGSYPEPPKETPCFNFKVAVTVTMNGYVFAETEEKARELILEKNWDEADFDSLTVEVEEVLSLEED